MAKQKLIIVHGMGNWTTSSFEKEFIEGGNAAFSLYPAGSIGDSFELAIQENVDLEVVSYNDIFEEYREKLKGGTELQSVLTSIPHMSNSSLGQAMAVLSEFEGNFQGDSFFATHWADVLFYRFSYLGELVRIRLAKVITKAVIDFGGKNVHVLGHSLGCAVVHDTLAALYDAQYNLNDIGQDELEDLQTLSCITHKLGSVQMVANTSRVLQRDNAKVGNSVVNPGSGGCTRYYREYRHSLDPITWPKPFDPTNNGGWISSTLFKKRYKLVKVSEVTDQHGNTHSLPHYLYNPEVHNFLFLKVFGFDISHLSEQAQENYEQKTLLGVAEELVDSLEGLKKLNLENIKGVIEAAKTLSKFIKNLGGQFK